MAKPSLKEENDADCLTYLYAVMIISTQSKDFKLDAKLQRYIERKFRKLNRLYKRIINATIVLHNEETPDGLKSVSEIKLSLSGNILFVREAASSFEAAIDQAINAILRILNQKGLAKA